MIKRLIFILSITCAAYVAGAASLVSIPDDRNKPGDDKKEKSKREDTSKVSESAAALLQEDMELPDTLEITFPSHDLYTSWDTETAHPYKFSEEFKSDSVEICSPTLTICGFTLPFKGNLTSLFGWRKYRPHYGTDIDLETGQEVWLVLTAW